MVSEKPSDIHQCITSHLSFGIKMKYSLICLGLLGIFQTDLLTSLFWVLRFVFIRVSAHEYTTESSLQLLLVLYLWLSGGQLYLTPILSSLLIIGKCSAEEYLTGKPENLLAGKSAVEKLWLTVKHIPLFSLTAFFRVGAGVIKVRRPPWNQSWIKKTKSKDSVMGPFLQIWNLIVKM